MGTELCSIFIKNLYLTRRIKQLYKNFSLEFPAGQISALIGKSGCGKTSLLDVTAGLLQSDSGSVEFSCCCSSTGENKVSSMCVKPSYLFQEPRLLPWYSLQKNITVILDRIYGHAQSVERARAVLERVGLGSRTDALPSQLSGGERQRAAIARAFAFPSPVLLMDEAFQSQDLHLKLQLMELLENMLSEQMRTVVMVCHDIREALAVADNIFVLAGTPVSVVMKTENRWNRLNAPNGKKIPLADRYISPGQQGQDIEREILHILAQ